MKIKLGFLFTVMFSANLLFAYQVPVSEIPSLKPKLVLGPIKVHRGVAYVIHAKAYLKDSTSGTGQLVMFHEGYKQELLDTLCAKLGYGKGIDVTYVNVGGHILYDTELYLNRDGNFIFGAKLKDQAIKEFGNEENIILNGFYCRIK